MDPRYVLVLASSRSWSNEYLFGLCYTRSVHRVGREVCCKRRKKWKLDTGRDCWYRISEGGPSQIDMLITKRRSRQGYKTANRPLNSTEYTSCIRQRIGWWEIWSSFCRHSLYFVYGFKRVTHWYILWDGVSEARLSLSCFLVCCRY